MATNANVIHFGPKGWRARLDEGFNAANVMRLADGLGAAWAESNPSARVLIGFDTRPGAGGYARLVGEVLSGWGLDARISDRPCPTPALGWNLAHDDEACGGVMITASASPVDYQGVFVRDSQGLMPTGDFLEYVESLVPGDPSVQRGEVTTVNLMDGYLEALRGLVNADLIASAGLRLVVDSMHGSGSGYLADLLRSLGAEVRELHGEPSADLGGLHPCAIEPWVDKCERLVTQSKAHAGLVLDGDGDRYGLVTEDGTLVSASRTAAILLDHVVARNGGPGRVVMPLSGSTYIRRQARRLGCALTVTPIGFGWSYREMRRPDALLGVGEYGGISLAGHFLERDGLAACLLLCEMMAARACGAAFLARALDDQVGRLDFGQRDIRLDSARVQTLRMLLPGLNPEFVCGESPVDVSHADGLRLGFADGSWVMLRPSRTEPAVRIYAEAPTTSRRDELLDEACEIAREKSL